jgi:hypothetical protein
MRAAVVPILIGLGTVAIASISDPASASGTDAGADAGLSPHCATLATRLALPPDHGRCDDRACVAAGGSCAYAGFCFGQACVKKTHDAGATCTDSAQCESGCLAKDGTPPGPGTGACSPTQITLGCHLWVSHGVVPRAALCGD